MKNRSRLNVWLLTLTALLAALACGPLDTASEIVGGTFHAYYASPDGDDGNDCQSWEHACLTIDGALLKADDGDVIHVAAGTVSTLEAKIDKRVAIVGMGESATLLEWGYPAVLTIDSDVTVSDLAVTMFEGATEEPPCIAVLTGAALTMSRVELRNCGNGAYIYSGGEASFEQVTVSGADLDAVFNQGGTVTIRNSRLVENNDRAIGNTGTMVIEDTTIDHNLLHPWPAGGDLPKTTVTNAGHLELTRSTVSRSRQRGITNAGELIITNSTVSSNQDLGISSQDGVLTLRNATVAANSGNGIVVSGGQVEVENTIVSGNRVNCFWSPVARAHMSGVNLSEDCRYFTEGDPMLGPLADNGGPTETHALLSGSPAVDAAPADCLPEDQRGVERPLGVACDVGAYEQDPVLASEPTAFSAPVAILTITPAMDLPEVDIIKDTLCFDGPGDPHPVVGSVLQGSTAAVRGMGALDDWLVIENPRRPGVTCWIKRSDVEERGDLDTSVLKIFAVPPLPTPTPEPRRGVGCLVENPNNPKELICVPRSCTPNDQPGGRCTP